MDSATLIVGDIVRVRSGDRVPADLRLLTAARLQVDESALTGESVAANKSDDVVEADAGIGDRTSMLFSGTLSLTLAGEPAEPGIMHRRPRSQTEQVLSSRAITIVLIASLVIGGATLLVFLSRVSAPGTTPSRRPPRS